MANILFRQSTTATVPVSTTAKEAPLTNLELDGNFRSLNDNKIEITGTINLGTTGIALDRASAAQTLTGISIDGNAATVTNGVYTSSTVNIGTTGIALDRASAAQTLTGISIDGNAATVTNGVYTSSTVNIGTTGITLNRASAAQTLTGISIDGNAATVTDGVYTSSTVNIGTTSVALNRASAAQTLTGISIDGNAATVTNGVYTSIANTLTGTNIFRNAAGIRTEQSSTQDSVVLQGRAGGTSSFAVTLTPATLSANRTITLPDAAGVLIHDGGSYSNPTWITSLAETKVLPTQAGNTGKYLTTNGTSTSWADVTGAGGGTLDSLTDVIITTPSTGQVIKYNGTNWVNDTDATGAGGGITTGKAIAMAIVFGG